jgi:hypothetical protein
MAPSAKEGRKERSSDLAEAIRRLDEQSMVIDDLRRRISELERTVGKSETDDIVPVAEPACCSSELIGCLDDCVDDVKDLRKRTRHVRTSERRP